MGPTGDVTMRDAAELHRKYVEILAMRRAHDERTEIAGHLRPRMIALAARYPGALREMDVLRIDVIEERIERLEDVLDGARDADPWMPAMATFHALARGALCAKRWLAGRRHVDAAVECAYAGAVGAFAFPEDAWVWKDDLRRLASPPRGRLTALVFARLAQTLGVTEQTARSLVF